MDCWDFWAESIISLLPADVQQGVADGGDGAEKRYTPYRIRDEVECVDEIFVG